jgi:uncharacterized lipoprotein
MRGIFVVIALVTAACSAGQAPSGPVPITYHVTGSAPGVDITYAGNGGSTEQQSHLALPLGSGSGEGLTVTLSAGAVAYVSAQNTGDSGSVTCEIDTEQGNVIQTATSEGAYVIATCSGLVP